MRRCEGGEGRGGNKCPDVVEVLLFEGEEREKQKFVQEMRRFLSFF
jgi:hypothetical protein